jgi:hypothetical protein
MILVSENCIINMDKVATIEVKRKHDDGTQRQTSLFCWCPVPYRQRNTTFLFVLRGSIPCQL